MKEYSTGKKRKKSTVCDVFAARSSARERAEILHESEGCCVVRTFCCTTHMKSLSSADGHPENGASNDSSVRTTSNTSRTQKASSFHARF